MSTPAQRPQAKISQGIAPPHNIEAEQSVLGAILLSERTMYSLVIEEGLKPEDFYRDRHAAIYAAMLALYDASEPIDVLTVAQQLRRSGKLDEVGGADAVDLLAGAVPNVANLRHYAQIVREAALMRRLLTTTYVIQASVLDQRETVRDIVEQAEKTILEVAHGDRSQDFRKIDDILQVELEKLHRLSLEDTNLTGTPSGFTDLDAVTGGFQPGNLVVLAARPSMGKCLGASTLLRDPATGARRTIEELVASGETGKEVWVTSLCSDYQLRAARVTRFIRSGIQPTFELRTRLGRRLVVTANHPLLTIDGWRRLDELGPGDRIAVPRRLAVADAPSATMADPELVMLREVSVAAGRRPEHNWHVHRRGLSRSLVGQLAVAVGDDRLCDLAGPDVWWDEIVSIVPAGERETFDLAVPEYENFVADDIVVHNSSLVANIAENAAIEFGKPVALFSLEMSEAELAQRFIASQARIKGDDLRKGRVPEDRWPAIVKASHRLADAPLWVDDSSDIGLLEIRAKTRRLHSQHPEGLGLVIVDYLQLLRSDARTENRAEQIGHMSRGLKLLARELEVPVIALSQLNRGVEQRTDKRPLLSDLRESGAVEQDSDVVIFIYRDDYYNDESERPGEADLLISKHRNGALGTVVLTFQPQYPRFMNYISDERFA